MDIRTFRESLGISRESLALMLGVSYTTVSRWEQGEAEPSRLAVREIERLIEEIKQA